MADVASLLLEIETAQKSKVLARPTTGDTSFLGSLFDEDDDVQSLIKSNGSTSTSGAFEPDLSLCAIGKSMKLHQSEAKSNTNGDGNLKIVQSVEDEEIRADVHDARHKLSVFEMRDIIGTQQRLKANEDIHAAQWREDKQWHLRNEKLSLIQEDGQCSIDELEMERYRDLKTNTGNGLATGHSGTETGKWWAHF